MSAAPESEPVWKVGDIHPVVGTVCVEVDEHGVPRWDYPPGHEYEGVLERLLAQEAQDRAERRGRR